MSAWRATLSTTEEVDMYSLLFSPTKTTFQKCGMPICKENEMLLIKELHFANHVQRTALHTKKRDSRYKRAIMQQKKNKYFLKQVIICFTTNPNEHFSHIELSSLTYSIQLIKIATNMSLSLKMHQRTIANHPDSLFCHFAVNFTTRYSRGWEYTTTVLGNLLSCPVKELSSRYKSVEYSHGPSPRLLK